MQTDEFLLGDSQRIKVECNCGRRYALRSKHAGRSIRCRRCLGRVKVPSNGAVSGRSRKAILQEFGIDPEAAEAAFRSGERRLAEREAEQRLEAEALQVVVRGSAEEEPAEEAPVELTAAATAETLTKAAVLGVFLVIGLTGFLYTVFGAPFVAALAVSAVASAIATRSVHDHLARAAYGV